MPGNDRSVKLTVAATMDGFVRELDRGGQAAQGFQKKAVAAAKAVATGLHEQEAAAATVAKPLLAIGAAATLGFGYAVKTAADFDERLSSVKSLSHATAGEMESLRNVALTAGTAIGYSATQAADAEIELVKAGVQVADITGGALSGSLKLAAAGQIDVAEATSIAASTMTQFGKSGSDVTHIADLLAAGADKALGGVDDLGQGLKYLGPVAAANNISLEQTVGTMSLLAQNAILGEQAGTSLRGVLSSLTSPSKVAADTMEQYGISVYDAQGKFVGFNGVAEQLHEHLYKLGDAERNAALGRIFGNEQITAATILMKSGASEVDKWTKAVDEQGFATEQAVGKMDNLNGDVTKLKASFQTAAIVTGEAAQGPFRDVVQVVTDLINKYNEAPGAVQAVVLGVVGLTAAVTLGGGAMLIAVPKVVAYGAALKTLQQSNIPGVSRAAGAGLKAATGFGKGLAATAGFLTGPWGAALAVGALAIQSFSLAADSGKVAQDKLTNSIAVSVSSMDTLDKASKRSSLSRSLVGDYADSLKDLPALLDKVSDSGVKNWLFLSFNQQGAVKSLQDYGSALAQVASADAPAASRSFSDLVQKNDLNRTQTLKLLDTMSDYKSELTNQASALGINASKSNLLLLATGQYEKAASKATAPTKENAAALDQLQESGKDAAKAIDDTANALRNLTSPTLDAREAQRQLEAAIDGVSDSIKENGKSLNTQEAQGRANEAALDGIAQAALNAAGALYKQTGDQQQATSAMESGRKSLIAALGQYGITGKAAEDYADKIIGTPKDWATTFANNAGPAGGPVDALNGKIRAIPTGYNSTINVNVSGGANVEATKNAVDRLKAAIQSAAHVGAVTPIVAHASGGNVAYAGGGAVYGAGTGTSDSIDAKLSNGEHVVTAAEVALAGGHAAIYAWRKQLRDRRPGFAGGGEVRAARYSPASPMIVVAAQGGGGGGLNIEKLEVGVPEGSATPRGFADEIVWSLRTLQKGAIG